MTCPYITSLDRECGRESASGFCEFHGYLEQLDHLYLEDLLDATWSSTPVLDRVRTRLHTRIGELKMSGVRTWKEYGLVDEDGDLDFVFSETDDGLAQVRRIYQPEHGDKIVVRTVTSTYTDWEDVK